MTSNIMRENIDANQCDRHGFHHEINNISKINLEARFETVGS